MLVYTLTFQNVGGGTATGVVINETVPDHTVFHAAASSPGWSCADGSPAGASCTLAVPDLAPGGSGSRLFAVRVDQPAATVAIRNGVTIVDDQGNSAEGGFTTFVGEAAPALQKWGVFAVLALLTVLAYRRLGHR